LYTLIPLSIVGGIIFYNNRDLLNDESDATETVGVTWSDTALKDLKESSDSTRDSSGIGKPPVITDPVTDSGSTYKTHVFEKVVEPQRDSAGSIQGLKGIGNAKGYGQSEVISNISCRINDKNGITVRVSLELFYRDSSDRSQILLRRDQIRVVVQKLLRYKDLGGLKKDLIEPELTNVINGVFSRTVFHKIEIKDMQIEKVQRP